MLRYRRGTYATAFYWWGGINQLIVGPCMAYGCLVAFIYICQVKFDSKMELNASCLHSLASFVVFLLVFRLNQCMARYNEGKQGVFDLFLTLEDIMSTACFSLKGRDGAPKEKASEYGELAICAKINIVRLTMAFGISFMIHCRIVEAVSDAAGELEEEVMEQLLFLHTRLQGLLYAKEMELVDRALYITCELAENGNKLQTEVCRHHLAGELQGDPVVGDLGDEDGKTVAPLPKVTLMLLRHALMHPVCKVWGYPERLINVFVGMSTQIVGHLGSLHNVMAIPVPLLYIQHCRTLLYIFALTFPISIDKTEGFINNIFMPCVIFWAMLGFELIAESFENPLGNDDNDINVWEFLHGLEIHSKYCFEVTEANKTELSATLARPMEDFGLSHGLAAVKPDEEVHYPRRFEDYFCWLPMPKPLLSHLLTDHGDVDRMHRVRIGEGYSRFQHMMRVRAAKMSARRSQRTHSGSMYQAVLPEDPPDPEAQHESERNAVYAAAIDADPSVSKYYLVYRGVLATDEDARHAPLANTQRILAGKLVHSASVMNLDLVMSREFGEAKIKRCSSDVHNENDSADESAASGTSSARSIEAQPCEASAAIEEAAAQQSARVAPVEEVKPAARTSPAEAKGVAFAPWERAAAPAKQVPGEGGAASAMRHSMLLPRNLLSLPVPVAAEREDGETGSSGSVLSPGLPSKVLVSERLSATSSRSRYLTVESRHADALNNHSGGGGLRGSSEERRTELELGVRGGDTPATFAGTTFAATTAAAAEASAQGNAAHRPFAGADSSASSSLAAHLSGAAPSAGGRASGGSLLASRLSGASSVARSGSCAMDAAPSRPSGVVDVASTRPSRASGASSAAYSADAVGSATDVSRHSISRLPDASGVDGGGGGSYAASAPRAVAAASNRSSSADGREERSLLERRSAGALPPPTVTRYSLPGVTAREAVEEERNRLARKPTRDRRSSNLPAADGRRNAYASAVTAVASAAGAAVANLAARSRSQSRDAGCARGSAEAAVRGASAS